MKSLIAAILAVFCFTAGAAQAEGENQPVAKANGIPITQGEFLAAVAQLSPAEKAQFKANPQNEGRKLVNWLISMQLLAQLATERGLDKDPVTLRRLKEVEQSVQAVKNQPQMPGAQSYLAASRRVVLANAMLAAAKDNAQALVTEQSLVRYYTRTQQHYASIGIPSFQDGKPLFRAFLVNLAEKDLHDFLDAQSVVEIFPLQ